MNKIMAPNPNTDATIPRIKLFLSGITFPLNKKTKIIKLTQFITGKYYWIVNERIGKYFFIFVFRLSSYIRGDQQFPFRRD